MNEHALRVLEYDKVRSIVAAYAASAAGKAAVTLLHPASDPDTVQRLLGETREFIEILHRGEQPPFAGIVDVAHILDKLRVSGSMLSAADLFNTAATLAAGRRVKKFFQKFEGNEKYGAYPLLCAKAACIHPLKHIEDAVFAAIDEKNEVKDSASPALKKIRKSIGRVREDILARMTDILHDSGFQKVIQEPVITVRDDRYVLPLKPNFRQSLKGVVHGQSGSRATLFVEPLEVLDENNRLAELRMEEREEVERILRELTALLSLDAEPVEATINSLTQIDAVCARAQFGMDYGCVVSEVTHEKRLQLRSARHPLLVGKARIQARAGEIMPNDIVLDNEHRAMILSGPNAGGKTAILKTAGLLCLMAQSGLPIPAAEGSELPAFGSIFADIGDEQSLEQDLSTFSSHVSRIAEILREADKDSLVLLDELGSGTEPGEGAGLGAAVLESLIERGCVIVVTTHHNALKLFGSETSGAMNAAMEFDSQTLKPTYRLIPGRPGRSFGLDMASRMGIPASVIEKARARIGHDDVSLDLLLKQVEEDSRVIAAQRRSLEIELTTAQRERKETEEASKAARNEAREVKSRARTEANEIVTALRRRLRELSQAAALEQAEAKKTGAEVQALSKKLEPEIEQPTISEFSRDLHSGDTVRIPRLNKTGTVLASHRDSVELEVGGKKIRLSSAEVVPVAPEQGRRLPTAHSGWSAELHEDEGIVDRLNIIGLRVAEGLAEVERFIDRAGLHHLTVITVIHGLGTGALKTAVTEFLRDHPLIASIRPGKPAEGGAGVTIAELKK